MINAVYQVLGKERIAEICQEYGLASGDENAVKDILDEWEHLIGQSEKKIAVALEILKNNINSEKIISAIGSICSEFALKNIVEKRKN